MRAFVAAAAVAWIACVAPAAKAAAPATDFVIRDVRVFDGQRVIPRADVRVQGGVVAAVGPHLRAPAAIAVVDGRGKTLLPGLIDSHVHVYPGAAADALRFGVTTELDMFTVQPDFAAWRRQRQSLERTAAADVWSAGIGVTVPGGAPLNQAPPELKVPTLASLDRAKSFVDARVAEGSDYIKVFIEDLSEYGPARRLPTLSRPEVCAVIAAAHADGRMAIVHAQAEWAAREAIECGADGLAHMVPDKVVGPDFIRLAKAHRIFVITTDDVWAGASGLKLAADLAADPRIAPYLSPMQRQTLDATDPKPTPRFFPDALANTRLLHAAGIPILAGTDSPNPATGHGVALHEELANLVRAGFTPTQALTAATWLPARIFHLPGRGRIAKGARADLVLVRGDPTRRITDTRDIVTIWKNGYPVDRKPPTK